MSATGKLLQGESGCLVGTTLFHWAKLKTNLHDMLINANEHSDHLSEALDMFEQSIQLRSEAFGDLGKDTARFLVTVHA